MSCFKDIDPLGAHICESRVRDLFSIESEVFPYDLHEGHNIFDAYDRDGYGSFDK